MQELFTVIEKNSWVFFFCPETRRFGEITFKNYNISGCNLLDRRNYIRILTVTGGVWQSKIVFYNYFIFQKIGAEF